MTILYFMIIIGKVRWPICDMYQSSFITGEIRMLAVITSEIRMLAAITAEFRQLGVITGEFRKIALLLIRMRSDCYYTCVLKDLLMI